ncbi:MAG: MBL fold metallo-hydrolase [Rhodobacteraceae bacterium]|nr:MBL fold metallo-hydrolase [Paracoccaceae bacterium]
MTFSRRQPLAAGAAALGGLAAARLAPWAVPAAHAGAADAYASASGEIVVHPRAHASFVMTAPGVTIYNDPVGEASLYADLPPADLILITHHHGDHFKPETLAALVGENTALVVNPTVMEALPAELKAIATEIANGGETEAKGVSISAIPAYNTTEDRLKFHPKGRDNGYVLNLDGQRIYIAGDTEDIPEMRALEGVDMAFVPMNLPYTMTVEQAASGVAAFAPKVVYPYHYRDSDPMEFARLVGEAAPGVKVVQGPWYE